MPTPLTGLERALPLRSLRPLLVHRAPGPLTFALVSIAWLRAQPAAETERLAQARLTAAELDRFAELTLPGRKLEWLAGRLALKHTTADHLRRATTPDGPPVPDLRGLEVRAVEQGAQAGKPYLTAPAGWTRVPHIALSHSMDFALAVCGDGALGIDLEGRPMGRHIARLLAVPEGPDVPHGMRRVAAMPLALRWACREAVVKCTGVAGRTSLYQTRVTDWLPDGSFRWSLGTRQIKHADGPASFPAHGWAGGLGSYALAVTWR